jgi:hypothetical protein
MIISKKPNKLFVSLRLLLSAIIFLSLLRQGVFIAQAGSVVIDSVVGSGTVASCTEAALDAALAGGGWVIFNCGPMSATITITSVKTITVDTIIDGAGLITLSAVGVIPSTPLFIVNAAVTLRL